MNDIPRVKLPLPEIALERAKDFIAMIGHRAHYVHLSEARQRSQQRDVDISAVLIAYGYREIIPAPGTTAFDDALEAARKDALRAVIEKIDTLIRWREENLAEAWWWQRRSLRGGIDSLKIARGLIRTAVGE